MAAAAAAAGSSQQHEQSCSHIPSFSVRHPMIPRLYVMPWKQDMKNQRLLMKLWQGSLWFLWKSRCGSVVGSVSATARPPPTAPPLRPLLLSARRDSRLIAPPTSPDAQQLNTLVLLTSSG
ncbi:uncharacterized protein LOC113139132 isoform X4 [Mastacembelus armatus]|uniref:uncharacterized protein LOC113139132 isoform X4 n=1 Tax=Mastacembelus armatus TaxID=205130 RepID=UPI000E461E9F|nr:testis-expressed protein 43 isoform X4 [Mastacembelus armatus]